MAKKVLVGAEDAPTALSGGTCVRLAAGRIGGARELLARSYPEMSILRFLPPAFDDARTGMVAAVASTFRPALVKLFDPWTRSAAAVTSLPIWAYCAMPLAPEPAMLFWHWRHFFDGC